MKTGPKLILCRGAQDHVEAEIEIDSGSTLWEHLHKSGLRMPGTCGGRGTCGKCSVRILYGLHNLSEQTDSERTYALAEDERLACQARVISPEQDISISIKPSGAYAILTESIAARIPVDPCVFRKGDSVRGREPHDRRMGSYEGQILGVAVDVGTTTVVMQLVDLETGATLATSACKNPQDLYGEDVISRIGYADQHQDGLSRLQKTVTEAVNHLLSDMEHRAGTGLRSHVYEAVMVGNPTMRDIFFGIDVHSLGFSPFEPQGTSPVYVEANNLGLAMHPAAMAYGAPLVGGQVGADCLADILACDLHHRDRPAMIVDIGTNGEVAVGNRDRILAASNAAGGAFEGATVSCGSGATEGAVTKIRLHGGTVRLETIGGASPLGICGSGLIDLLAEMQREGIIDEKGRLAEPYRQKNVYQLPLQGSVIHISQKDINELRLARAGLVINQKTLLGEYGLTADRLEAICLVGGFGHYVTVDNAVAIGILPETHGRCAQIGNGALEGARQMLISRTRRQEAEDLAGRIEHVRLFDKPNLLDLYVEELSLKPWA